MTVLYIIRHGETDFNRDGRFQGQTDVPMNQLGRRQSEAVAARLAAVPLDVVYSSDLARAQECARIIAGPRTVVLDPRLREAHVGRVAGLTQAQIAVREPDYAAAFARDPDATPFPGGESALDVCRRAMEAFRTIVERYPDGRVAVVTHGALIKMVIADVLALPLPERHRTVFENCGLSVVEWGPQRRRIKSLNDTGHLAEAPSEVRTEF